MEEKTLIDNPEKALNSIVWYLARRDHSEAELHKKMRNRYTREAILKAIEIAKSRKWICPPEELAIKVAQSLHKKNKGYLYILNYLKNKGLPPVFKEEEVELDKAQEILKTKLKLNLNLTFEDKQKAQRLLKNRGFDLETIKAAIHLKNETN